MIKPMCFSCDYWELSEDPDLEDMGECRRHCPVVIEGQTFGMWPVTGANDWCGEFRDSIGGTGSRA